MNSQNYADFLGVGKRGVRPDETVVTVAQPLTVQDIGKKISAIDAVQIELIGSKIIEQVMNNLGTVGKARVAQQIMQKRGASSSGPMDIMMRMTMMHAKMDMEGGEAQFFSEKNAAKFLLSALWPVKEKIEKSFSRPDWFLEYGAHFQISNYEPTGFLRETSEKTGIEVTINDVPSKYYVFLKLDKELTQQKSELVFSLTQKSDGVEFAQETFTLTELMQSFE